MSISYDIFPITPPGQSLDVDQSATRGPSWNLKQTPKWNTHLKRAVNGRSLSIKYWNNPLWNFEFTFEVMVDDPSKPYSLYTVPIPATDFEIIKSFYHNMQGQGNQFAYQPFDSVVTGTLTAATVSAGPAGTGTATILLNSNQADNIRLGNTYYASGFSIATFLNTKNVTVIEISNNTLTNRTTIVVSGSFTNTGATSVDSGTLVGGQPLAAADANNNIELVHTVGNYPTTITSNPTVKLITESVQLIDTSTLAVYDGSGNGLSFTLNNPDTVAGYTGYVMHFSSTPTPPIRAAYTWFYLCRFSEDTQEYENFITMLWSCSSVKIIQDRI